MTALMVGEGEGKERSGGFSYGLHNFFFLLGRYPRVGLEWDYRVNGSRSWQRRGDRHVF